MCLVCFTVAGTIVAGTQLPPMLAHELAQAPELSFSSSQIYDEGAASLSSSFGQPFTSIGNPLASKTSDPVDQCRIKEASQNKAIFGDQNYTKAGFPVSQLTQNSGVVQWALIPIDFEDLPGEENFRPRVDTQMKLLTDWFDTVSGGRLKVEWVVQDEWVRLPGKSSDYAIDRSVNLGDDKNGPKLFRDAMNAADPDFDFSNIQTVNFILPKGQTFIGEGSQGFPWDPVVKEYKSKEGPISSYSIPGLYFEQPNRNYWSYWAHEFGHAIALPHVGRSRGTIPPFSPWDLMGGQDGPSRELSGWLRLLAGWFSDSQVYCTEAGALQSKTLNLAPLSSEESGHKLAIFRLSSTSAIMIESRRETKFSCKTQPGRNGVLVYFYDAKLGHNEDFLVPITEPGRTRQDTSCNVEPHIDALLRAGDRVTFGGITVDVVRVAGKDTVRVWKRNVSKSIGLRTMTAI
jgi:M6 family metalloprotease-like protein